MSVIQLLLNCSSKNKYNMQSLQYLIIVTISEGYFFSKREDSTGNITKSNNRNN